MTRERDRADAAVGVAAKASDEVAKDCAICGKVIPAGEEYTVAAYGPVHNEPCSHEVKETGDGIPIV